MGSGEEKSWWRGAIDKVEGQIENRKSALAAIEEQYGQQTLGQVFGTKRIYIYAKGYVQVMELIGAKANAPVEKLLAIEAQSDVTKKSGFGRGAGAALTLGVNLSSSNMRGDVYLSIGTETSSYSLRASPSTGTVQAAKALEMAGKAAMAVAAAGESQQPAAQAPDALDQLKKLADLHEAGILTDEEFAAKKADLLDRM